MDSMIKKYMQEDYLIAKGSTREVYRAGSLVIKKHTHILGYQQSRNEEAIYRSLPIEDWKRYLTKPHDVCEAYAVFDYIEPLEINALYGCDIGCCDLEDIYPLAVRDFEQRHEAHLVSYLSETHKVLIDDLYVTHNIGINGARTHFVFLDYRLTQDLSKQYDKALERGEISYLVLENCPLCGGDAIFKITGEKEEMTSCEFCG